MVELQLFKLPVPCHIQNCQSNHLVPLWAPCLWFHQPCSQPHVLELLSLRLILLQGEEFLPVLCRKEALEIEKEDSMEWKLQFFHAISSTAGEESWQKFENAAFWCCLLLPNISGRTLVLGNLIFGSNFFVAFFTELLTPGDLHSTTLNYQ